MVRISTLLLLIFNMSYSTLDDVPHRRLPSFTRTGPPSLTGRRPNMSFSVAQFPPSPATNRNEHAHRNPTELPMSLPHSPPAPPIAPCALLQSQPPWRGFQPWTRPNSRQGSLGQTWRDYDARRPNSPIPVKVTSSRPRECALEICSDPLRANQSGEG